MKLVKDNWTSIFLKFLFIYLFFINCSEKTVNEWEFVSISGEWAGNYVLEYEDQRTETIPVFIRFTSQSYVIWYDSTRGDERIICDSRGTKALFTGQVTLIPTTENLLNKICDTTYNLRGVFQVELPEEIMEDTLILTQTSGTVTKTIYLTIRSTIS